MPRVRCGATPAPRGSRPRCGGGRFRRGPPRGRSKPGTGRSPRRGGRALFTAASTAEPIETVHGPFAVRAAAGDTSEQLSLCLQQRMSDLELEVARMAGDADLVCVDGPLRRGGQLPGTVGYIKTHRV